MSSARRSWHQLFVVFLAVLLIASASPTTTSAESSPIVGSALAVELVPDDLYGYAQAASAQRPSDNHSDRLEWGGHRQANPEGPGLHVAEYEYDCAAPSTNGEAGAVASASRQALARQACAVVDSRRSDAGAVRLRPTQESSAPNSSNDFVNLASPDRTRHILDGEVRPNGSFGGGHRPGTGFPKKSEFPPHWSDDKIMHEISDVATDPSLVWRPGDGPTDFWVNGTRDFVDIEVLIRNDEIWTGYPTNVIRNPE